LETIEFSSVSLIWKKVLGVGYTTDLMENLTDEKSAYLLALIKTAE
jgi:hypothetical protein